MRLGVWWIVFAAKFQSILLRKIDKDGREWLVLDPGYGFTIQTLHKIYFILNHSHCDFTVKSETMIIIDSLIGSDV